MAINRELIEARIREINDTIQILKDLMEKDFEKLTLYEKLSMRYLVIQLVEAASSICTHILYIVFNERVEGFPECFSRLGVKGIIPEALALKLNSAARLKNLLVHKYLMISDKKVYENVKDGLRDFEDFTLYVREKVEEFDSKKFKYYELPFDEKMKILEKVKVELMSLDVVFAYIYGSFLQRSLFKDLDVAVWIKNSNEAFNYIVNSSAEISYKLNIPVDIQVLNEGPLPFKYHVFTEGRLLFSKDESLRLRVVDEVIRKYLDLKILMDISSIPKDKE